MTDRNRTYQNGKVSTHSDVQCESTNRQTSFSGWGNVRIKLPFSGHIANKFRRPTILQLNIEGLTVSKMNVFHHLAMQSEALVILLQETYCTDAEKLVLPHYQLAGSSLSKKHGLAISQCFLTPVCTLAILTVVMLTGVMMTTVWTVSAWLAGQVLIVLPSYIMPRTLPVFTPAAGTLAPIQI